MPDTPPTFCRPDCPYHGQPNDNVYLIVCDCGEEEMVCGWCLGEGRITACRGCTTKQADKN